MSHLDDVTGEEYRGFRLRFKERDYHGDGLIYEGDITPTSEEAKSVFGNVIRHHTETVMRQSSDAKAHFLEHAHTVIDALLQRAGL